LATEIGLNEKVLPFYSKTLGNKIYPFAPWWS
jgi:hypothetical protein